MNSVNPNLSTKELGGVGRIHNLENSREIVKKITIPIFLAGGLTPKNALQAIKQVNPYGLDLCSGVRLNKLLDVDKLAVFFSAINKK